MPDSPGKPSAAPVHNPSTAASMGERSTSVSGAGSWMSRSCLSTSRVPELVEPPDPDADQSGQAVPAITPIADLGGWISGACLAIDELTENRSGTVPAVWHVVQTVARLGCGLPAWRVHQSAAGWVGQRATATGIPTRIVRGGLPALEEAMTLAELAFVREAHPAWSIRPVEHGQGYTGQRGDPPTLLGRTLGDLDAAIASYERTH